MSMALLVASENSTHDANFPTFTCAGSQRSLIGGAFADVSGSWPKCAVDAARGAPLAPPGCSSS